MEFPKAIMDITVSDLEIMSNAVNYRRWLFSQVENYIGNRIVEIGAGIGNYTEFMLNRELIILIEIHQDAVQLLKDKFAEKNIQVIQGDITDREFRRLAPYSCDTAICFNVLEHVENDQEALENMFHILIPGGRLLLIVPALPFLLGTVDQSLGHYRRYTKRTLQTVVHSAGYEIEHLAYMNFMGIFGWFWNNRIARWQAENPGQILFFDRYITPWLSVVERVIPPPIGLSLVCIARRPDI